MPQNPTYSCYLGAQGWQHSGWQGRFYPDDLPAEWQLTYYNNFFSCTYLNYREWAGTSVATWRERLNDVQPQFRLILQTPAALEHNEHAVFKLLEPHIGFCDGTPPDGFVQTGSLIWFGSDLDLKRLAQEISTARSKTAPVYLVSRDADLAALEQVRTLLEVLGC